jgi:uncharacterized damage-inducible protein DinB
MTVKTQMIKEFAQIGFDRLSRAIKDIKPEQLDWKSCQEANTIRWILTHLNEELHIYLPKFMGAEPTKNWPKDYVGNKNFKIDKMIKDQESGKRKLFANLNKLTNERLEEEIDGFSGKKPRRSYIMLFVTEILHHEGQIAAILGVEKRMKGLK